MIDLSLFFGVVELQSYEAVICLPYTQTEHSIVNSNHG